MEYDDINTIQCFWLLVDSSCLAALSQLHKSLDFFVCVLVCAVSSSVQKISRKANLHREKSLLCGVYSMMTNFSGSKCIPV